MSCFLLFQEYIGSKDQNTVFISDLIQPIRAQYVRILPQEWYGHISLRMELYGCDSGKIFVMSRATFSNRGQSHHLRVPHHDRCSSVCVFFFFLLSPAKDHLHNCIIIIGLSVWHQKSLHLHNWKIYPELMQIFGNGKWRLFYFILFFVMDFWDTSKESRE